MDTAREQAILSMSTTLPAKLPASRILQYYLDLETTGKVVKVAVSVLRAYSQHELHHAESLVQPMSSMPMVKKVLVQIRHMEQYYYYYVS